MKPPRWILIITVLLAMTAPTVLAHTPLNLDEGNHSPETAFEIPNPTKSWTLYRELHEPGEAEYYVVELDPGDRLLVSVFTPVNEDPRFLPSLTVMIPDGHDEDSHGHIEAPEGYESATVEANRPDKPEYEPFTPTSYFYLAKYELTSEEGGVYYFAVHEDAHHGRYGLAVGYVETFTLLEWLRIPLDVISIHRWEGQHLALILAPLALTLVVGFAILIRKNLLRPDSLRVIGPTAGLLYIGGGLMTMVQMLTALAAAPSSAALLTAIFVAVPLALGYSILRRTIGAEGVPKRRDRAMIALHGALGLFTWSGLIIGPALAFLVSILPPGNQRRSAPAQTRPG